MNDERNAKFKSVNSFKKRVISFVLTGVMVLSLIPSSIITAQAATTDKASLDDQIKANGSANVTLTLEHLTNPSIVTSKKTIAGNYIGKYTDSTGATGMAYCINHDKRGPTGWRHGTKMKVTQSSTLDSNKLLTNTYMIGYNEARNSTAYYKAVIKHVMSIYGSTNSRVTNACSGWVDSITNDEWRKASQLAIWMSTKTAGGIPNISIEGQFGWANGAMTTSVDNQNAKDYIYKSANASSASATRALKAAICLYAWSSYLTAINFSFADRVASLEQYPMAKDTFDSLWDSSTNVLDFSSLGDDGKKGTLEDAYKQFKDTGAIYEEDNYYVIDWQANSATLAQDPFKISVSGTPSGTLVNAFHTSNMAAFKTRYGFDDSASNDPKNPISHDSVSAKTSISIQAAHMTSGSGNTDKNFGAVQWVPPGQTNNGKECYPVYFKVMIPKSEAGNTGSININVSVTALTYKTFLAESTVAADSGKAQGFITGDVRKKLTSQAVVNWGKTATPPPVIPDDDDKKYTAVYGVVTKISDPDGEGLDGALFRFRSTQTGYDGTFVTDSFGTVNMQWTDPDSNNYIKPGTYMVTEVKAPLGYNLDDRGAQMITLHADGTSSGNLVFKNTKRPTIYVEKVDQDGTPLAGAIFSVWKDGKYIGDTEETGDNGRVEFNGTDGNGLENGYYEFQEKVAPSGYILSKEKLGIHVDVNTFYQHPTLEDNKITFVNYQYPPIIIKKVDAESGTELSGAVFKIMIDGEVFKEQAITDENGEIRFSYDEYKDFLNANQQDGKTSWTISVTEVSAPNGWNRDKQTGNTYTLTQELKLGEALEDFVFTDTSYRSVQVTKKDADTDWPLAGATFELSSVTLDEGGTYKKQLTTDATGFVIFEDVPNGTYQLKEITPPTGYQGNSEVKTIVVTSADDPIIEFEYKNEPKSGMRIIKLDAATDQPIKGATFRIEPLLPLTSPAFERTTDDNGLIVLENLAEGTYKVTEVSVPEPYVLNPQVQTVEIKNQHDAVQVTFRDNAKGMLYIQKLDGVTQEPLAGAYFDIHTAGGKLVATVGPTGPNGYVTFSGLEPGGSYVVKEIKAPDGHVIDPTPQSFQVDATDSGKIYTLIFNNMPKANLWVRKSDANTGVGLQGAVFKIVKGNGEIVRENVTTNEGGFLKVNGLEEGTYQIIETKAPAGYVLNSTPKIVTLKYGSTEVVEIENQKPGSLSIRKVDATTGNALAGAVFQLYSIDDKPIGATVTTGADGYARWTDLEDGFYTVQEVSAPGGYAKDTTIRKFEVKAFETTEYEWKNTQYATITVVKKDAETLEPLSGATFEIRTLNGTVVDTLTTDLTGSATSKQLDLGWYTIVETKAPTGYILNAEASQVEVKGGTPVVVEKTNTKSKGITIHKVDGITKAPLAGAVFELQTIDGKLIDKAYTTDAAGTVTTNAVQPGQYYLVETKAPEGYILSTEKTLVSVEADKASSVTIVNMPKSTIQINKTNSVTGDPIMGVTFKIARYDGTIVENVTTDKTGHAYSQVLDPGEYVVTETKAASGYTLDATAHKATVKAGENTILNITNAPDTSLTITKISSADRSPVAGAVFQVEKVCGIEPCIIIGQYTSDEYGKATTEPLTPGIYRVKEISAPNGFIKDDEVHEVCVKAGQFNNVIIENQPAATLIARKIDSVTNKPIAGAVFKLETADHSLIGTLETDANGEAIFTNLKAGHYIVTETQAPAGYELSSPNSQTITIKYGVNNYCDFIDAQHGSLVIILQDKHTSKYLPGGQFIVTRESDQNIVFDSKTDVTGTLVVGDLKPGWYTVKQVFAPDDYTMVDVEIKVEIKAGQQQTVYFKDETASLVIEKIDSKNPQLMLEGARFKVTRESDGIVIGEYVTGTDGLAMCKGLAAGRYTIQEIVSPDGYTIDEQPKTIEVKGGTSAHVTFTNTAKASITVNVVDKNTRAPISGAIVEVWKQNGSLVNTFTSDVTGVIETLKLDPGYYTVKLIKAPDGYTATTTETTIQVVNGEEGTYTFELVSNGVLKVISTSNKDVAIPGMKFSIAKIDGTEVGSYVTGTNGTYTVPSLEPGWYIVTETQAPEGYTIGTTQQKVEVTANGTATVTFQHTKTFGLQIRTTNQQNGTAVAGAVYEITNLNGAFIGTFTSDKAGLAFAELEPGWYIVTPKFVPNGMRIADSTPRTIQVLGDRLTVTDFVVTQLSGIRVKVIDGSTNRGIYGVRVLLKNGSTCVKEYTTNNEGYITLDQAIVSGNYTLEMISVPSSYRVDTIPKSIGVLNGETTEITWKLYKDAGQIQVVVTSADYNRTRDLPAGSNLQGAVFEIMNADTYQTVGQMISDASGVAASSGLPIGRYMVKMITAPAYYACSDKEIEVRLKINNDVVRTEMQCKSVTLGTKISQKTNNTIKAGSSMRVDITEAKNASDVRLDNFNIHIKVPTDAARISTLNTGTFNSAVWYSISYKTNMQDYRKLAGNLLSTSRYTYDLSTKSLGLQAGEYVTDIRMEFGTVPAGFAATSKTAYSLYVLSSVYNGYKMTCRAELGGQYNTTTVSTNHVTSTWGNGTGTSTGSTGTSGTAAISGNSGQWTTNASTWTTTVSNPGKYPSKLPTTGY